MLDFIIQCADYFLCNYKKLIRGVIEIDRTIIYLSYKSNKRAVSLSFFVAGTFWLFIINMGMRLLISLVDLHIIINAFIYIMVFVLYLSICMGAYGTDIGSYIKINTKKNIIGECVHQDTIKGFLSEWFLPYIVIFFLQEILYVTEIYDIKVSLKWYLVILFVMVGAEFILIASMYMSIPKDDFITVNSGKKIRIVLNNSKKALKYKCSNIILNVLKNNDILLRNKDYAYYVSKMKIIKAKDINYIKIGSIKIKLINNKWTIL